MNINQPLNVIDMKVTVVHKTFREHYMLFRIPNSLSGLLVEMQNRMIRSTSAILDELNESFTGGCWMGRISWCDKHGDEILLVDDTDYQYFTHLIRRGAQGTMIIRLASAKPVPEGWLKQKPIKYSFDSSVSVGPSVAPEILLARQMPQGSGMPLHKHVSCDACGDEIRGHRYNCLNCQNYDLCMTCEGNYYHKDHIMVRLPMPGNRFRDVYRVFQEKLREFATKMVSVV